MIDTDEKLPNDITWKNVVILVACVIEYDDKCYAQILLEDALCVK